MSWTVLVTLLVAQAAADVATVDGRDTLMIMAPAVSPNDPSLRAQFASALAREAAHEPRARVFSSSDIAQLADLAAQQQLAACDSDACITEIGDAMGARYVLFSTVQRLGSEHHLELRLLDAHSGDIVSRANSSAHAAADLLDTVDDVMSEVLRAPFPPPPVWARPAVVASIAGLGVGVLGAAAAGYAAFHFDGVARDASSSGDDKSRAYALGPLCLAGAVVGGVVAVGSAVVVGIAAR